MTQHDANLFDPGLPEAELFAQLSRMHFEPLGEGHAARVYGDTSGRIVLKVFPPVRIDSSQEIAFIRRNMVLRNIEWLTVRWGHLRAVAWFRRKVKGVLALALSRKDPEERQKAGDSYIEGYRLCIDRGLMRGLPTRVLPNWVPELDIPVSRVLRPYWAKPAQMVMQRRFRPDMLVAAALEARCKTGAAGDECRALIDAAMDDAVRLWGYGLMDAEPRFSVLDSRFVLPDGHIQLYDANNVTASPGYAWWTIRSKQGDMSRIMAKLDDGRYPALLFDTEPSSVADAARGLYQRLPADRRDDLVVYFLRRAAEILREDTFRAHWTGGMP